MRVLVVGGGGREHALAWALARDAERVYAAPGNAGTAAEPGVQNVPLSADDHRGLADFAERERLDFCLVGPEAPLVAGIADYFGGRGLACFGPSAAAARLEGSKVWAKEFMVRHGIPTARAECFDDLESALAALDGRDWPLVVKDDALAAGKGVVVAAERAAAERALRATLGGGGRVLLEDFMEGEEASFMVVTDGEHSLVMPSSQDHKRAFDGDRGPNTGGMGAYSPAPIVDEAMEALVMERIVAPLLAGMRAEGMPYRGFLYVGLMIDGSGPRVVEFNCRLGDPETQPLMMRLRSSLGRLCLDCLHGRLARHRADWDARPALGVVLAARGYPGDYERGVPLPPLPPHPQCKLFCAGVAADGGALRTSGGRVLCATALGDDLAAARRLAYRQLESFADARLFYRRDIGQRALEPL